MSDKPEAPEFPHGRDRWPPPPGSSYSEFLQWATFGAVNSPSDEDMQLAIGLWSGRIEHPGEDPNPEWSIENPPAPYF